MVFSNLIPRFSHSPVFDHVQYTKSGVVISNPKLEVEKTWKQGYASSTFEVLCLWGD